MHPTLQKPGYRSLRAGRCSETNRAYLLTTVTHRREPLFRDWEPASTMSRLIASPDTWPGGQVACWILMPDHWHGVVVLTGGASIAQLMNRAKGSSAFRFNQRMGRTGRVWADGFHDRAIRRDEDLVSVARYVVANPVRAGLVGSVAAYPFWDACWVGGGGEDVVYPVVEGRRA
jgi:REP element-mobilizing transposase RayT